MSATSPRQLAPVPAESRRRRRSRRRSIVSASIVPRSATREELRRREVLAEHAARRGWSPRGAPMGSRSPRAGRRGRGQPSAPAPIRDVEARPRLSTEISGNEPRMKIRRSNASTISARPPLEQRGQVLGAPVDLVGAARRRRSVAARRSRARPRAGPGRPGSGSSAAQNRSAASVQCVGRCEQRGSARRTSSGVLGLGVGPRSRPGGRRAVDGRDDLRLVGSTPCASADPSVADRRGHRLGRRRCADRRRPADAAGELGELGIGEAPDEVGSGSPAPAASDRPRSKP